MKRAHSKVLAILLGICLLLAVPIGLLLVRGWSGTPAAPDRTQTSARPAPTPEPTPTPLAFTRVDPSYFDDALFIGDSRTVGLRLYGTLQNADYFASEGLSVFGVLGASADVPGVGRVQLQSLLAQKQYGKIYMMFGVNELGYSAERFAAQYSEVVQTLRALQPDALVFLEANLHLGQQRSDSDPTFNNPNLNAYNDAIAGLADGERVFYINLNEIFDDENGYLRAECSSDSLHLYPQYYADWCDWLCTRGIDPDRAFARNA